MVSTMTVIVWAYFFINIKKMKFTCSVIINRPKAIVAALMDNPDNLKHWQDGFISYEDIEGEPGKIGAKARMVYDIKGKQLELVETIIDNQMPDYFKASYYSVPTENTLILKISEMEPNKTRVVQQIEYTRMTGIVINIMAAVFPRLFKNQTQKWLNQFKTFVESQA